MLVASLVVVVLSLWQKVASSTRSSSSTASVSVSSIHTVIGTMQGTFVEVVQRLPEVLDSFLRYTPLRSLLIVSQSNTHLFRAAREVAAEMFLAAPLMWWPNDDTASETRIQRIISLTLERGDGALLDMDVFKVVVRLQVCLNKLRCVSIGQKCNVPLAEVIDILLEHVQHLDVRLSSAHAVCRDALALLFRKDPDIVLQQDVSRVFPYLQKIWRRACVDDDVTLEWVVTTLYQNATMPYDIWLFYRCVLSK